MAKTKARASYHHGDLPAALVDAAFELIGENGVHGFSVAEAARQTGVSISAPYRHFSDRDELLAACATTSCEELQRYFEAAFAQHETPEDKLSAAAAAYVRFAAERRPMFEVLFGAGLDKTKYPELAAAGGAVASVVLAIARELVPNRDEEAAGILVQALTSLAQGYATQLLEGKLSDSSQAVEIASERASTATAALLQGRRRLFSGSQSG